MKKQTHHKFLPSESLPGGDLRNPLHPDPTISHAHAHAHATGSDYIHKNSGVCYEYTPPYILFLSFIYIKNVYSRREGHFGGVLSVW